MSNNFMSKIRKWSRIIHRDLSYFFSGVIIIYAISGFMLNHKRDFRPNYTINTYDFNIEGPYPLLQEQFSEERVLAILESYKEVDNYNRHSFSNDEIMTIFLKGGSTIKVDLSNGNGIYVQHKTRPIISQFNRLHYNPHRGWTIFSDVFAFSLIVITITGLIMTRGKNGLRGRGGIEFIIGIMIPLLFILLA